MLFRSLFLALATLGSQAVFAGNTTTEDTFFVRFHFGADYYGKKVSAVAAHYGVLQENGNWQGVGDTQLSQRSGGSFFGKAVTVSSVQITSPQIRGPVVVYFVSFEDGSSEIVTPKDEQGNLQLIKVTQNGGRFYRGCTGPSGDCIKVDRVSEIANDYNRQQEGVETFATTYSLYH